jgi:hypothetical protein
MRIVRFIAVAVILCAGIAGQSDAQKPARRANNTSPEELARTRRDSATINGLLETWEKCAEQLSSGTRVATWCDTYNERLRQTPLDALVFPEIAAKLQANLTVEDIEWLKISIGNAATGGYYYHKGKGETPTEQLKVKKGSAK